MVHPYFIYIFPNIHIKEGNDIQYDGTGYRSFIDKESNFALQWAILLF